MRFHTSLPVEDIQQTVEFYRVLFDADPVKTKSDYAKFLPAGLNISFHENPEAVGKLSTLHLGFELPDTAALERAYQRLAAAGLISQERETSVCCYALQDKFWVTDPNGYAWELYLRLEDTEQKISSDTACCAASAREGAAGCC